MFAIHEIDLDGDLVKSRFRRTAQCDTRCPGGWTTIRAEVEFLSTR